MSGISGIFGLNDQNLLTKMLDKIKHRGPDGTKTYIDNKIALGNNILALSNGYSDKLIVNESGDKCISFDGFIYNQQELKGLLGNHEFKTNSTAEVLLHLYEEKGPQFVNMLKGMFAIAIFGGDHMFLARDPAGLKPLYYGVEGDVLYFSSEIKSLLLAVDKILTFPSGHYFVSPNNFTPYFTPTFKINADNSVETVIPRIQTILTESLAKQSNEPDPRIGVMLSGGIDSSVIAAYAKQAYPRTKTYFVGVENSPDLEFSRKAATHLHTDHTEHILSESELIESISKTIYYLESFDYALVRSSVAQFIGTNIVSKDVNLALCGEGGDELFGGYSYLKPMTEDELRKELIDITFKSGSTGFQRVDRMFLANSVEGRMPFMNPDLIEYAMGISTSLKLFGPEQTSKWILRKSAENMLPEQVVWQPKRKFWEGSGVANTLQMFTEKQISDQEFKLEQEKYPNVKIRTKEELYYFRIFKTFFDNKSAIESVGSTSHV